MKVFIVVRLQVEGLHSWENCNIKEVDFLRNKHRHLFHIECKKEVKELDREIEIIQLKRKITEFIESNSNNNNGYKCVDFGNMSCEEIAKHLLNAFNLDSCQVLEDNENGAHVCR